MTPVYGILFIYYMYLALFVQQSVAQNGRNASQNKQFYPDQCRIYMTLRSY